MVAGYRAQRRLEAHQPGVRGRSPDRAAAVLRDGEWRDAGRHRGHGAAAGTAGGEQQIPRIAGDAEHRVGGVAFERELGHVGLADDESPDGTRASDRQLVVGTAVIAQGRCAPGGGLVEREQAVLHRDRNAVEWRQRLSERMPTGRGAGLVQELRVAPRNHRVELRVDGLQPRQAGLRNIQRRQGQAPKPLPHVAGAQTPNAVLAHLILFLTSARRKCGQHALFRIAVCGHFRRSGQPARRCRRSMSCGPAVRVA